MQRLFWVLLTLVAFFLPIERRYDRLFRFYSKTLIPDGLSLPSGFDYKIFFFPSDLIAPLLCCLAVFAFRSSWRAVLFPPGAAWLWGMLFFALASLLASPLSHYPLVYFRLWQLLTVVFLFCTVASLSEESRALATRALFTGWIAIASFEALLALIQYFHQGALGLRFLGEPRFHPSMAGSPSFELAGGARWIVDRWTGYESSTNTVIRAMGTMNHPNVLGGFLAMGTLLLFPLYTQARRWRLLFGPLLFLLLLGLTVSFSRAGMIAVALGSLVWLVWHWRRGERAATVSLLLCLALSVAAIALLFHEQLDARGGILNYTPSVQGSDQERIHFQHVALRLIESCPTLGVGYSLYSYWVPGMLPVHNIYLLWTAETGLFSGLCFLFFLLQLFRRGLSAPASPYLPALLAIFVAFLFIGGCDLYFLISQQGRLMFFLLAGLLSLHGARRGERRAQTTSWSA